MSKHKNKIQKQISRRDCIKKTALATAGVILAPTIVPSSVFGKDASSNKINIGQIVIATFWILFIFALVAFTVLYDPNAQYSGSYFDDVAKSMRW